MDDIIGLVPAGGVGSRLGPLPFSKELFPLGYETRVQHGAEVTMPRVVSQHVIEGMRAAGAKRCIIILGPHKEDIVHYYGDGARFGMHFCYLMQEEPTGMPGALELAWPWIGEQSTVLFGMPDTLFKPLHAFEILLRSHREAGNDVTLGAFPTDKPWKYGMLDTDAEGNLTELIDKPEQTNLTYMWGIACWSYQFAKLMHDYLLAHPTPVKEIVLGDIFESAMRVGLRSRAVKLVDGSYLDIGTPDDLIVALQQFNLS